MTGAVLAEVGATLAGWWAQAEPAQDLIRSGYAQIGFLALLLAGGWWEIRQANKRTDAEREQRIKEVAEERARTEQERERAREAEARERKSAEAVFPALHEANRALEMVTRLTDRGPTRK